MAHSSSQVKSVKRAESKGSLTKQFNSTSNLHGLRKPLLDYCSNRKDSSAKGKQVWFYFCLLMPKNVYIDLNHLLQRHRNKNLSFYWIHHNRTNPLLNLLQSYLTYLNGHYLIALLEQKVKGFFDVALKLKLLKSLLTVVSSLAQHLRICSQINN